MSLALDDNEELDRGCWLVLALLKLHLHLHLELVGAEGRGGCREGEPQVSVEGLIEQVLCGEGDGEASCGEEGMAAAAVLKAASRGEATTGAQGEVERVCACPETAAHCRLLLTACAMAARACLVE